ncbi:MAG TPA: hypothetical protein DDW23_07855 [Planctomycetes bacterium]|nr:hypothetical protein [Planctomycetota bacterium]
MIPTPRLSNRAPWLEGGLLALVVFCVYFFGGEAVLVSYHGMLHSAVGEAVLRGGFAPDNPYHAGESLRYYLLYPGLGVGIGRVGIGPLWGFALLNCIAALLFGPALDSLGKSFGLGWISRRFVFLAAILGFNGFGWFVGLFADPIGPRPPLLALSHTTGTGLAWAWDARLQAFLPKFLNPSSFSLALPFGIFLLSHAAQAQGRAKRAILPASLALALNPLVGLFFGTIAALWKLPSCVRQQGFARWAWPLSGIISVVLALPFLWPLVGESVSGPSLLAGFSFSGSAASNFFGPLFLLLVAGCLGMSQASLRMRWMIAVGVACALLGLFSGPLPWGNEYKFARLAGVLLAVPAGIFLSRLRNNFGLVILVFTLPTLWMVLSSYLSWDRSLATDPPRWEVEGGRLVAPGSLILNAEASIPESVPLLVLGDPGGRLRQGISITGNPLAPLLHRSLLVDEPHIHNARIPSLRSRLEDRRKVRQGDASALQRMRLLLPKEAMMVMSEIGGSEESVLRLAGARLLAEEETVKLWLLPPLDN